MQRKVAPAVRWLNRHVAVTANHLFRRNVRPFLIPNRIPLLHRAFKFNARQTLANIERQITNSRNGSRNGNIGYECEYEKC